ncbi:MAG TPA: hypothetical protein VGS57_22430 [Thermoanaerobaculia bacterium]|jgi:hypothetical protein|nr:hypothetical protein [Thermoanaerobaculia bacterium]
METTASVAIVAPPESSAAARIRDIATDAIRCWERWRLVYNLVLAVVVAGHFLAGWPASRQVLTANGALMLFVDAVLGNVAYCAAYPVDFFAQLSGLREEWRRRRWLLLALGTAFAATVAHFAVLGPFGLDSR